MRIQLLTALSLVAFPAANLAAPDADQLRRGRLESLQTEVADGSSLASLTVRGANPCRRLLFDFGDGTSAALAVEQLPVTMRHVYAGGGVYHVTVTGTGGCRGTVDATVQVPQTGTGNVIDDGVNLRFRGMDRNRDGVITRAEWRGNARSFAVHDHNQDGILSGTEMRGDATVTPGAARGRVGTGTDDVEFEEWTAARFRELDRDGDGLLTPEEWPDSAQRFAFADRDDDYTIRLSEFTWDLFSSLDRNGDEIVTAAEWHWSRQSFLRLDRDADGVLTRGEMGRSDVGPGQIADAERRVVVDATARWTDTRIMVGAGDVLTFDATGTVSLSQAGGDVASPAGSRTGRTASLAPLPHVPAGALIARVGSSLPFLVGDDREPFRAPASGVLHLSVNDDHLADNRGAFEVVVRVVR